MKLDYFPIESNFSNLSDLTAGAPSGILTTWAEVWKMFAIAVLVGMWIGFGIGYQCYRMGIRFPWHKE